MKTLHLILLITSLAIFVGCSKDKDSNNTTGIDFTNEEWYGEFDYIFMIDNNYNMPLQLETSDFVESSELIINNFVINTSNWVPCGDEYGDWLNWYCNFNDIPDSLNLSPGSILEISLTINGINNSGSITIPNELIVDFPVFDVTQNYDFSWEITENPITHLVWFGCGDDNWSDYVYGNYQLSSSLREYSIEKSLYSDFVATGVDWFEIGIDAANYNDLGECIFLSACGDSYDEGKFEEKSRKDRNRRILNQISKIR